MKKMKRLAALFLAVVMIMAMGLTAFAVENTETTYTISLAGGKTVPANHTYEIYQIFKGKISEVTKDGKLVKVLTDIEWGKNYGPIEGKTPQEAAEAITDANTFAEGIAENLRNQEPVASIAANEGSTTVTESGYYLIKDVSSVAAGQQDTVSSFMVELAGDVAISPKVSEVPDFKKEISQKTAFAYAAGDSVPFTLTATLKSDIATADTYQLTFNDTLTNLAFQQDTVKVFYKLPEGEETEVTDKTNWSVSTKGNSFTVTIPNVKAFGNVSEGTDIIVKYSATLSENAFAGNVADNKATLNFGRNGNNQGVGSTKEVEVKLYTFALKFNKVDENGDALLGAGFTLFAEDGTTKVRDEVTDVTTFEFKGLSAGTYVLKETKVPNGYNSLEDITITLDASEDNGVITPSISGAEDWKAMGAGDDAAAENNAYTFGTDITNYAGVVLPSTGGIGTTIFYVVGGILVLGAAVLLITKKRMSARN